MVGIAVVVLAPTLVFGRVDFDDLWLWSDDSPLRHASFATLRDVFCELDARARHPLGSEYLPVRDVVVMLDMAVWGDGERGPHLTQLVLYAATICGLGTLLVRFGFSRPVAWVATLLWAVHPLHVESVAWLSERKGVLAGLFVIATGHAWVRFRANGRAWWIAVAAVAAVAGVWSKAPAMFGPVAFALWDLLLLPRHRRRWIAIGVVGAAALAAAVPVIAIAQDARIIDDSGTHPHRIVSAVGALGHYVESVVGAHQPSIAYPIQTAGPSPIDLAVGGLAVAGSLALAWWCRKRARTHELAVLGWAWVWFIPISHLVIRVHIPVADRFAYLWSLAPCLAVALLVDRLRPLPRLAITGALVCGLGIATVRAEGAWASTSDLYARAFATNPRDWRAVQNHANALVAEGRLADALAAVERGLALQPDQGYLLALEARYLDQAGRRDEALAVSARAAESGLSSVMAQHADRLRAHGRATEALAWIDRSVTRQPTMAIYARTKATILLDLGRPADAEAVLRGALELDEAPTTHLMLAGLLLRLGRPAEAAPHLDAAAADPALRAQATALRAALPR